jgi:hypothetical protein
MYSALDLRPELRTNGLFVLGEPLYPFVLSLSFRSW